MGMGDGEHPNGRKAMDDLVKRQVESGVSREAAVKRARETALRDDRKRNK